MKNIVRIIVISKPLHRILTGLALLILIGVGLDLAVPLISKLIVDEIVAKVSGGSGDNFKLFFFIGAIFVLSILRVALTAISERIGDHFAGRLRQLLTEKFYDKVLSLPQSYFDSELSGKIVNQLNRSITTVQGFLNAATNFIVPMFLQSIFIVFVLAKFSLPVALFTFALFPVYMAISYYSAKKWGESEVEKNKFDDLARGRINEVIGNIKIIRGFNTQRHEFNLVSKALSEVNRIYAGQSRTFHIYDFLRNFSLNFILLGVNIVVFYNTFQGVFTIGEMVLIIQLITQARIPLFAMSFILTQIQMAEAGSKEYFEILALKSTEDFGSEYQRQKVKKPTIEFKNVSFRYEKSDLVLDDVSFKIGSREKVALVGPSGAGKTTIVNLILKFYEPTGGEIYLKDKPYSQLSHHFVRNNIALVFQENELFSATIRENVAYGARSTEREIIKALELANAWEFVKNLSKGLDSEVGERGVRLSGGQKQRIQIARAILRNAPILILDEATSNLDAKSEKEVQDALENLMKDKLVIVIAHRFSTIQSVDKVAVIDKGKIVEFGNPRELAHKPGIYQDLLNFQIEGNKKLLEGFELY
ncbi:MAG: ABC transporter-related protein [Microgenomates group bacterium GW2011_GWA1_48_10]|nr:MAG: ABC transporter-related protein [Microgenomates group bacterium GW2011_GWA1_48_10]